MSQSPIQTNPSSQSWSSYILSAYSSSVSPTYDPDQYEPTATPISPSSSTSPNPNTMSSSSSSSTPTTTNHPSPWGPYTKSGRGGAGNFTWQSSHQPTPTTHTDPEANPPPPQQSSLLSQRQKAAAESEARELADALASKQAAEYAHVGRGGAGNWTPSVELAPPASAPEVAAPPPPPPTLISMSATAGAGDPYRAAKSGYYGRGGAGNFNTGSEEARRVAEEKERKRREEELRRRVEESVQLEMRRPEGAVTREGRERDFSRFM